MRLRILAGSASAIAMLFAASAALPSTASVTAPAPKPVVQQAPAVPPGSFLNMAATNGWPKQIDLKSYNRNTGPNMSQRVVLSFDDCPRNLRVLDEALTFARDHHIGMLLAPTGDCYDKFNKYYHFDLGEHIRSFGQYAINHSRTHANLTKLTPAGIRWELSGQVKADYGRPPFGARDKKVDDVYKSVGMREWLWNVDTRDWAGGGHPEAEIVRYVVDHACAGCTVLMHMQHAAFNPHALRSIEVQLRTGPKKLKLCRPFRGWGNPPNGPVLPAPANWGNYALPC